MLNLIRFLYHPFSATDIVLFSYPSELTKAEAHAKAYASLEEAKNACESLLLDKNSTVRNWPHGTSHGMAVFKHMKSTLEDQGFKQVLIGDISCISMSL